MNFRSKAQMEMMGLVVIVILITLGLLFLAVFKLQGGSKTREIFTAKGLASSTMGALMKATASSEEGCAGEAVSLQDQPHLGADILEDCAIYHAEYRPAVFSSSSQTYPQAYSDYRCRGVHSCTFFQAKSKELFDATLTKWGKNYEFKAILVGTQKKTLIQFKGGSGCPGEKESSGIFPLQTDTGEVISELVVC